MSHERILAISDLHFGSGDDLLRSPRVLEILEPELQWADVLVLNGDVWELLTGDLDAAVNNSRLFFDLVAEHIDQVVFIPGNHDYHFVAQAADRHRFSRYIGIDEETPFRLHMAEMLIEGLTGGKCDVRSAYPLIELGGVTFHHGHYITPHLPGKGLGARFFDRLTWRLAGLERDSSKGLTVADYEALMAPLHELLYQSAQLPSSARTRDSGERFLQFATKVMRTPGQLTRKALSLVTPSMRSKEEEHTNPHALFLMTGPEEAALAMVDVCDNLGISLGPVCFGHSHAPFDGLEKSGWTLYNSGSWILDHREMAFPGYARLAWPGTVIRVSDGVLERRDLLADCTLQELVEMMNEELPLKLAPISRLKPPKRRRRRRRRVLAL